MFFFNVFIKFLLQLSIVFRILFQFCYRKSFLSLASCNHLQARHIFLSFQIWDTRGNIISISMLYGIIKLTSELSYLRPFPILPHSNYLSLNNQPKLSNTFPKPISPQQIKSTNFFILNNSHKVFLIRK